ncbi:MAG: GNAT family N-acetyltransferase [Deltaproteobacteria bacterium]|nr:GNAT family N-acetyltransferase [Deltaproteobacteria bacterium]
MLRRPATPWDRDFLEDAHIRALGPVVLVGYGWTAERLRSQFLKEVALASCWVISAEGARAGYVSVEDRKTHWYIDAIAIVPNYQRRGVGEAAMRDVFLEAGRMPVRLSVMHVNRARTFYRRLGFRVIGGDRQRELLEWRQQPTLG